MVAIGHRLETVGDAEVVAVVSLLADDRQRCGVIGGIGSELAGGFGFRSGGEHVVGLGGDHERDIEQILGSRHLRPGSGARLGLGADRDQFVLVTSRTGCPVTAATVRKSRSSVRIVSRCRSAVTLMRRSTGPAERWWPVSVSRC